MEDTVIRRMGFVGVLLFWALAVLLGAPGAPAQRKVSAAEPKVSASQLTALKALGSRSAPITIEIFSDFQCPACRNNFEATVRPLIDNYVVTGKVYLVHRDFPLPIHSHSRDAARWANAAAHLGKFEKVEAVLYAKQDTWGQSGNIEGALNGVLTPSELKRARQLVESGQLDAAIDSDIALGNSKRVSQTPSLFVTHGGETTPLAPGPRGVSYSFLKQYLDYLLKQ
jgi:protein-disulfide isomerase